MILRRTFSLTLVVTGENANSDICFNFACLLRSKLFYENTLKFLYIDLLI